MGTKHEGHIMTLTQQEILNIIQEEITKKYEDIDFREGSLVYDLTSPLAYVVEKIFSVLEDLDQKFNILTASEDILKIWATPRIGLKYPGTYTRILVTGNEVSDSQWALSKNNNYTFSIETTNENGLVWLKADQIGYIPIGINDEVTSVNFLQKATITTIELGKDEETLENYRKRYIESLFIDSQNGTTTYIQNHIMEHPKVGYAGVDYVTSIGSTYLVTVYITGVDYLPITDDAVITEIQNYYYNNRSNSNTNIMPWGVGLHLVSVEKIDIAVQINIKNMIAGFTSEIVRNFLEELRKTIYVPNLFHTENLKTTIDIDDLRNRLASEFSEYGVISSILLNTAMENIDLEKTVPNWTEISIQSEVV